MVVGVFGFLGEHTRFDHASCGLFLGVLHDENAWLQNPSFLSGCVAFWGRVRCKAGVAINSKINSDVYFVELREPTVCPPCLRNQPSGSSSSSGLFLSQSRAKVPTFMTLT